MKESAYILKRRMLAFGNQLAFYICRIFPINNRRVAVCTFEGRGGFGCNPKYIIQELHKQKPDYQIIWFVNDMEKQFPDYIKKIPNTLWNRAYWLSTSKIWIDNYRKPFGTIKRKKQMYINTWHATQAFKSTGLWRGKAFSKMAYLVSKNDSDMVDYFVIDSKWCEEVYPKGMLFDGEFLKVGAPRCDILYGDRKAEKESFRRKHNLSENSKVVMFAPTFRETSKDGVRGVFSEIWSIDFVRLLENLKKRFDGEWYLCIRVHPQLAANFKGYKNEELADRIIDASLEDDMYEVLAAMDAYITDYSSAAMDASLTHMPVFLYADDIEKYTKDRGSLLWNLSADTSQTVTNNKKMTPHLDLILPYTISKDNDELEKNIINFDEADYIEKMEKYENEIDLVFDGMASKKIVDKLLEK